MLLTKVPSYFKARRDRLMKENPDSVFIFPAHPDYIRNSDVHHPYRQDSSLYYLTGFDEPESCLVLAPSKSKPGTYRTILFVLPRDPEREMWDGPRYGMDGAQAVFGAHEAYPIAELDQTLSRFLLQI